MWIAVFILSILLIVMSIAFKRKFDILLKRLQGLEWVVHHKDIKIQEKEVNK